MVVYLDIVVLLNFLVDFFLLLGTNSLCGHPPGWKRAALAAVAGSIYGGACLLPGFYFLGNTLWRLVSLLLIAWIAFGFSVSALRRSIVFILLSMALGGLATGFGKSGFVMLIGAAAGVFLMCFLGFRGRIGAASYVPVELSYQGKSMRLTALRDTGNALRDPVTGNPVLVVGADVAKQLLGLTQQQLCSPVSTVTDAAVPGLRLIPYRAVGQSCGMLLALRMQQVRIGKWKGSSLVAFAPDGLCREGDYQALTGGMAWG
jgi:stage II sporulation protein GA (sporulation sigma-E factor processing peptidase)